MPQQAAAFAAGRHARRPASRHWVAHRGITHLPKLDFLTVQPPREAQQIERIRPSGAWRVTPIRQIAEELADPETGRGPAGQQPHLAVPRPRNCSSVTRRRYLSGIALCQRPQLQRCVVPYRTSLISRLRDGPPAGAWSRSARNGARRPRSLGLRTATPATCSTVTILSLSVSRYVATPPTTRSAASIPANTLGAVLSSGDTTRNRTTPTRSRTRSSVDR